MWGLMALISGAILAPDAIKKSRIPEFGTIAYWRYSHPEMSLLDIVKARNAMNDDLEDWEVKMLIEAGYTLDMMCKLAKPTYNRLMEDEKRKEEVDNSASYDNSPLKEESLVEKDESKDLTAYENSLRTEENLAVKSDDYEVYIDPKKKSGKRNHVVYNVATEEFIRDENKSLIYYFKKEAVKEYIKHEEVEPHTVKTEKGNDANKPYPVYRYQPYEVYWDETKTDDRCYVIYNTVTKQFIGEGGKTFHFEKDTAMVFAKNFGEEWERKTTEKS